LVVSPVITGLDPVIFLGVMAGSGPAMMKKETAQS
jgi:hypothetical protein